MIKRIGQTTTRRPTDPPRRRPRFAVGDLVTGTIDDETQILGEVTDVTPAVYSWDEDRFEVLGVRADAPTIRIGMPFLASQLVAGHQAEASDKPAEETARAGPILGARGVDLAVGPTAADCAAIRQHLAAIGELLDRMGKQEM